MCVPYSASWCIHSVYRFQGFRGTRRRKVIYLWQPPRRKNMQNIYKICWGVRKNETQKSIKRILNITFRKQSSTIPFSRYSIKPLQTWDCTPKTLNWAMGLEGIWNICDPINYIYIFFISLNSWVSLSLSSSICLY